MKKQSKRIIIIIALLLMVITSVILAVPAFAEWDGTGNPVSGNSQAATGGFGIYADSNDLVGYRFHVFSKTGDGTGNLVGHGIDVYVNTFTSSNRLMIRNTNKPFHDGSDLTLASFYSGATLTADNEFLYDEFSPELSVTDPANQMEGWLNRTDIQKQLLAYCGVNNLSSNSFYITVEPILTGVAAGSRYTLTLSEWAKMQSAYYGVSTIPTGSNGTYNWIASWLGNRYLSTVYTSRDYTFNGVTIKNPAPYATSWTETIGGNSVTSHGMRWQESNAEHSYIVLLLLRLSDHYDRHLVAFRC